MTKKSVPAYRRRRGRNAAIVTLADALTRRRKDYYLGEYGEPESREKYHRLIAEWEANDRRLPDQEDAAPRRPGGPSLSRLILSYWQEVKDYYSPSEAATVRLTLGIVREFYGSDPAVSFGPNKLRKVREEMIRRGWVRTGINGRVHRIRAMFRWAASHEILPESVYRQLQTVEPLKRGRTKAQESTPVRPVPEHRIDAVRPFVSRQVWALIQVQLHSGARGGELFPMRPLDLNMGGDVWLYRPAEHKTAHHGHERTILIGPKGQSILRPFLAGRPVDSPLFSPREAEAERRARLSEERTTPLSCGNRPGSNRRTRPEREPGDIYTKNTYHRAITRACDQAFTPPERLARIRVKGRKGTRWETPQERKKRLGPKKWAELQALRKENRWHPHQLRHAAATNIRREFGIEAAKQILGHSSLTMAQLYAEPDLESARRIIGEVG